MSQGRKAWLSVALIILFFATVYAAKRKVLKQLEQKSHRAEFAVRQLEASKNMEWCDEQVAERRLFVAKVLDRFRKKIDDLRLTKKPDPEKLGNYISLGKVFVSPLPKERPKVLYDRTVFNWNDIYNSLQKTQHTEDKNLWLDADSSAEFLLKLDTRRLVQAEKFLPPDQKEHNFRVNPNIKRISKRDFLLELDPGDFSDHKDIVKKMVEEVWRSKTRRVLVQWVEKNPDLYKMKIDLNGTHSFTNHSKRIISMKKFVHYRTFAHEVGHALGFDDHYYEVWHPEYCYYTQEYRSSDLMSDSENGLVRERHWEILESAYPWKASGQKSNFTYQYGGE